MADTTTSGITLTVIKPDEDEEKNKLIHLFCSECLEIDAIIGRKETPYCGWQKKGPWTTAHNVDLRKVCVVCVDLAQSPCPRCGMGGNNHE